MTNPFATAWQTSYTGDAWHFAKEASFSPSDLDKGIVKNVTPLHPMLLTDDMVERACRVHNVGWSLWHEPQKETARQVMKSALNSALRVRNEL